jgi:ATP-grasp ribosomal peptide maturase
MARDTVLVLTGAKDPTADVVIEELARRGVPVARHDLGDFPTRMRFSAWHMGDGWAGRLSGPDATTDLQDVSAIYYRRPSNFRFPPELSAGDRVYAQEEARIGVGGVLAALDCRWVNHPHRVARAEWKPLQIEIARTCGLPTPRTLISDDSQEAIEFAERLGGPVVCKSLSSVVLAEEGQHKVVYTRRVDPTTISPRDFGATVHLIQEWVPKRREARVTVVGGQVLAVAIDSDSDAGRVDWRSDYDSLRYTSTDAPPEIADGMRRYLACTGLSFGAFDFVITPDGEWIMLECNPAGQWLWLHHIAGLAIPAALADTLTGAAA